MSDHDSPISLSGSATNLAKSIVAEEGGHWPVPEGTILASAVRRLTAFVLDSIIVSSILMVATKGYLIDAWNLTLWASKDFHFSLAMVSILLVSHWLYWRLTGIHYSRSLGQKMMGLAVVAEDGSEMTSDMWDRRSARKLLYLIFPFSAYFGGYDLLRITRRHTHQSNVDLHVGSIVVHSFSLPPAMRQHIK
jgi:uncharacterized RDD family membrane protein YckC